MVRIGARGRPLLVSALTVAVLSVVLLANASASFGFSWSSRIALPSRMGYIDCPTPQVCVGIQATASAVVVVASSDPSGGLGAWKQVSSGYPSLAAVSCPSASFCAIDDAQDHILTSADPTGAWQTTTIPVPGGYQLGNISCASASLCAVTTFRGGMYGYGKYLLVSTNPSGGTGAWRVI